MIHLFKSFLFFLINFRIDLWVAIMITACDVFLFLLLENTGIRIFESLFAILIAIMGGSFLYMVISLTRSLSLSLSFDLFDLRIFDVFDIIKIGLQYVIAQPDQAQVAKGVIIPWCENCTSQEVRQLIGIVGSIVMPHNLFFHSCLVLVN